jgi:hypothetical protein
MKTINPILKLVRGFACIVLCTITCSFTPSGGPKERSASWQTLHQTSEVEIRYRYEECKLTTNGTHNEIVYLQVRNRTNSTIHVEWNSELWYNGKCSGCEPGDTENSKSILLKPGEIKEGSCSAFCPSELRIFSKMLGSGSKSALTDFNLKDITVTTVIN